MYALYILVAAASLVVNLRAASALEFGKNAPFQMAGIQLNDEGFGSEAVALNEEQAAFAPAPDRHEKNASMPVLQDRSLELTRRQTCSTGYWYCPNFGRCCPRTNLCCSYGYCIDPAATCCPSGPCDPGYKCCSASTCGPPGSECCSDGNYCSAGNICVKLYDSGRIVCCTDLKCTAAVVSGSTSYVRTSTQAAPPVPTSTQVAPPVPTITRAPATTQVIVNQYYTWYWTVTWWYLSFYYTTFRAASTVTYTTIYSTTIYTTTAVDSAEASSRFAVLSRSLTFTPPASATSLASLLDAVPSQTPTFDGNVQSTVGPKRTSTSSTSSTSSAASAARSVTSVGPQGPGGVSSAGSVVVGCIFLGSALMSGMLMIWL